MTETAGRPLLLAVLGHPVAHSLSPVMHEAALAAVGWSGRYIACDVAPSDLEAALRGLRVLGFVGCNVTVPLKEAAARLATVCSAEAARSGSVNTLALEADGVLRADTTDGRGLLAALREEVGFEAAGRRVVVLGAGGAARGIVGALLAAGARNVSVANRTLERARSLAATFGTRVRPVALDVEALGPALASADLLVQATTVGMGTDGLPIPESALESLPVAAIVCDIVYAPPETALMRLARRSGHPVVGGLGMLAWQAALAWEVWFQRTGPVAVFRQAAGRALAGRAGDVAGGVR